MADPSEIIDAVKSYLDITWTLSPQESNKMTGIIERGMKYLDNISGESFDYAVEDKPRELLMDYVRYVRANALDEFQKNYLHELINLKARGGDDTEQIESADV